MAALGQLESGIRKMNDPDGDRALILLKAIQANLTPLPSTVEAVERLERYLATDDIISQAEVPNGFGVVVAIRRPLLRSLGQVRAALVL
jgi:hypothetical protein